MGVEYKMDFFVAEFLASTAAMTGPERGAYALSLLIGWTQGATLPKDPERVRRALGYDPAEWEHIWPVLEAKWPIIGVHRENPRQVSELRKAHERARGIHLRTTAGNEAQARKRAETTPETTPKGVRNGSERGSETAPEKGPPFPVPRSPSSVPREPSPVPGNEDGIAPSGDDAKRRRTHTHRKPFVIPTIDEVAAYIAEQGFTFTAQAFIDGNAQKGWLVGKTRTPMSDWRAACRTWGRNDATSFGANKPAPKKLTERGLFDKDAPPLVQQYAEACSQAARDPNRPPTRPATPEEEEAIAKWYALPPRVKP